MKKWIVLSFLSVSNFLFWQNNGIEISNHTIKNNVPKGFNGFKILQIADLQNKSFGRNHKILIDKMKLLTPDIIVITGDLLDRNRTNIAVAMDFIRQAKNIAPIYFVTGNHEHQSPNNSIEILFKNLKKENINILDNKKITISRNNSEIEIIGINDYSVNRKYGEILESLSNKEYFQILLTHRPELFPDYSKYDIDLVFAGHAHGGQIRLPYIGGIFAPNQGLFPLYTEGMHIENNTTMIVSRGLGNSTFPFRINNRPELILVNLESKEELI